ncbi:MAG: hypothetical protein IT374_26245 [Polyangiaceae bacterium]|nr:hypothetical protein [Polyangiaceae bacterium]
MRREIDTLRADLMRANAMLRESHERIAQVCARPSRPAPGRKAQSMRVVRGGGARLRVLIVEDDALTGRTYLRLLARQFDALLCPTIGDARHAIEARAWDVAVIDLDMRDGSGASLVATIRDSDRARENERREAGQAAATRIVIASGLGASDVDDHLRRHGVDRRDVVEIHAKWDDPDALVASVAMR